MSFILHSRLPLLHLLIFFRMWTPEFMLRPFFNISHVSFYLLCSRHLFFVFSQKVSFSITDFSFLLIILNNKKMLLSTSLCSFLLNLLLCLSFHLSLSRPCSLIRPASSSSRWAGPAELCSDWPPSGVGPAGQSVPARCVRSVCCGSGSKTRG